MPHIQLNNVTLYYEDTGAGSTNETIIFAHGVLWSGRMFDYQVAELRGRYRCITFDFRGQGQSPVTRDGYDMETLTLDAVALIEALGAGPCHFAGLSMGGFVGMRLAARHPHLLRSLILLETSPDPEPFLLKYRLQLMLSVVRLLGRAGMRMVVGSGMKIMFGRKFLTDPDRAAECQLWQQRGLDNHPQGMLRAMQGVNSRRGVYDELARISLPTLVMVGDQDVATVPAKAERIHARIAGSQLVVIPGAGHTSTVEEPAFVNAALSEFLAMGSLPKRESAAVGPVPHADTIA